MLHWVVWRPSPSADDEGGNMESERWDGSNSKARGGGLIAPVCGERVYKGWEKIGRTALSTGPAGGITVTCV